MTVVSNSSPLIVFQRIKRIGLLKDVFGALFIPMAVDFEVFTNTERPGWITAVQLTLPIPASIMALSLGAGEREAMALALEQQATLLILDDQPARRLAKRLGIPITGSAGVLLRAKKAGVISAVSPLLREMQKTEFRLSDEVVRIILAESDEAEAG